MELGERLKQARLEAGLSQRQLCGEKMTRNMLSLIENGSARPSMDTLTYLAERLGRPVSWFLEEQTVTSPNQALMVQARQAEPKAVLALLKDYREPDDSFDRERWLLEAFSCLELAREAIDQGKEAYARSLLEQAGQAGSKTPYYTRELERSRLLLCGEAGMPTLPLVEKLPDLTPELLLRAGAAEEPEAALRILEAAPTRNLQWHKLRADNLFALERYAEALEDYKLAVELDPKRIYRRLEECCSALEDYKMAYYYACKQR